MVENVKQTNSANLDTSALHPLEQHLQQLESELSEKESSYHGFYESPLSYGLEIMHKLPLIGSIFKPLNNRLENNRDIIAREIETLKEARLNLLNNIANLKSQQLGEFSKYSNARLALQRAGFTPHIIASNLSSINAPKADNTAVNWSSLQNVRKKDKENNFGELLILLRLLQLLK